MCCSVWREDGVAVQHGLVFTAHGKPAHEEVNGVAPPLFDLARTSTHLLSVHGLHARTHTFTQSRTPALTPLRTPALTTLRTLARPHSRLHSPCWLPFCTAGSDSFCFYAGAWPNNSSEGSAWVLFRRNISCAVGYVWPVDYIHRQV